MISRKLHGSENECAKYDVTNNYSFVSTPVLPFLVRFCEALGNDRFFASWVLQVAQDLFLRGDSASCLYDWLFYKGFLTKWKLCTFHCIWPLIKKKLYKSKQRTLFSRACEKSLGMQSNQVLKCQSRQLLKERHAFLSADGHFPGSSDVALLTECSKLAVAVGNQSRIANAIPPRKKTSDSTLCWPVFCMCR